MRKHITGRPPGNLLLFRNRFMRLSGTENDKRKIVADEKLKKVFDGKDEVDMFEMTKLVSKHLS